ncbi:MAG: toprim domain-containing protein [Chitinophagaceae bacterium]|nr:toprim domain-containing protein [Chitinophagaceae bacterium]
MIEGEKVYITEGEFDAMLLEDLGHRAIAIPGVGNLPKIEKFRLLTKAEIVVCPDNDEAGKRMLDTVQKIFRDLGKDVYVKRFGEKDVTDFVRSITIDELIEEVGK